MSLSVAGHWQKMSATSWFQTASISSLDTDRQFDLALYSQTSSCLTSSAIGSTECGALIRMSPRSPIGEWQYWTLNPALEAKLDPQPEKGLYELIIRVIPSFLHVFNGTNVLTN
jgi:hypothetical protein